MLKQKLPWRAVAVIDPGNDDTVEKMESISKKDNRIRLWVNKEHRGASYNRYLAGRVAMGNPEDIHVHLDLDDELLPNCLEVLKAKYETGVWMTYGNWINQHGRIFEMEMEFPEEIHRKRDYRKVTWRSTQCRSYKKFLFDEIKPADLMVDGEFPKVTTESSLMFCLLEMCGKNRIGVVKEPIYLYRENRQGGIVDQYGFAFRRKVYEKVIKMPKKNLYEGR